MAKENIFISYSRRDSKKVESLVKTLEENGHTVWFDRHNIQGGEKWRAEIVSGIKNCDFFILLLSPDSVSSKYVQQELNIADQENKIIIPVDLITTIIPDEMALSLSPVHRIDFIHSLELGLQQLIEALENKNYSGDYVERKKEVELKNKERILILIESGLYKNAYNKCIDILSDDPSSPTINVLAGISYFLWKGENKLRDNHIRIIERRFLRAAKNEFTYPTVLAIFGCIKHNYCHINRMSDNPPFTLKKIIHDLQPKKNKIDHELLQQIQPTQAALSFLGIQ